MAHDIKPMNKAIVSNYLNPIEEFHALKFNMRLFISQQIIFTYIECTPLLQSSVTLFLCYHVNLVLRHLLFKLFKKLDA